MFAHVHDGMCAEFFAQPDVKGEVVVRRHEVRGMVGFGGVDVVTARRLQTDNNVAETQNRQFEARFRNGCVG